MNEKVIYIRNYISINKLMAALIVGIKNTYIIKFGKENLLSGEREKI